MQSKIPKFTPCRLNSSNYYIPNTIFASYNKGKVIGKLFFYNKKKYILIIFFWPVFFQEDLQVKHKSYIRKSIYITFEYPSIYTILNKLPKSNSIERLYTALRRVLWILLIFL